ncbi:uncharacterized protein STAUR_5740 [Stigmatella aurantiaca DW4/3-1]|uniref:Uncharacterized protein n=3 Tax=Stigmatella aurantiaca TaxID=41 RepID=Q08P55_STIAD|nr:uncharacterized protein STAUR_5740 [Stigmatella aurantiaca DW4/3-1]EAU62261.1 hypothetical protein STIAU_5264 [Stigmatella aurantiaca DW4/3-1]
MSFWTSAVYDLTHHLERHHLEVATMQWMGRLAFGIAMALCAPVWADAGDGFGKTDIISSKEVSASLNGCTYKVRAEKERPTGYPEPPFNIYARIEADPSGACSTPPAVTLLGTSQYEPDIFINVDPAGFVASYTEWYSIRGMGIFGKANAVRVDLNTASVLRRVQLNGSAVPPNGGGGGPGTATVQHVFIDGSGSLIVIGGYGLNVLCYEYPRVCAYGQGTGYTAVFLNFFTSGQDPLLILY